MRINKLPQIPVASGKAKTKKTLTVCSGIKRNENGEGKLPKLPAPVTSKLTEWFPTFTAFFRGNEEPSASQALEEAEIISPSVSGSGKSTEQNIISLCVDEKDQPLIEGFLRDLQVSNPNVYAALQSILKNNLLSLVPELLKPEIRESISSLNINQSLEDETEQKNALNKVKLNLLGINEESQILIESFVESLRINNPNTHLCLKLILEKNPNLNKELLKPEIRENINNLNIVALGTETEQRSALVKVKNNLRGIKEKEESSIEIINDEKSIDNFRRVIIPSLQLTQEEQTAFAALDPGFQLELMEGYYALKKLEDSNKKFPLASTQFLELGIQEANSPLIFNLKENTLAEEKFHIKLIKYFTSNSGILSTKKLARFIDVSTQKLVDSTEELVNLKDIIGVFIHVEDFWSLSEKEKEKARQVLGTIDIVKNLGNPVSHAYGGSISPRYSFSPLINKIFEDYLTFKPKEGRFESIISDISDSNEPMVLDYSNLEDLEALKVAASQGVNKRVGDLDYLIRLIKEAKDEFHNLFPEEAKELDLVSSFDKLKWGMLREEEDGGGRFVGKSKQFEDLKKVVDEMMETAKNDPETNDDSRNQISLYEKACKEGRPGFKVLLEYGDLIRFRFLRESVQTNAVKFYQILGKAIDQEFDFENWRKGETLEESIEKVLISLNEKNQRPVGIAKTNGTFNSATIPLNDEMGVADRFNQVTREHLDYLRTLGPSGDLFEESIEYRIPFRIKQFEDLPLKDKKSQALREVILDLFCGRNFIGLQQSAEIKQLLSVAKEHILENNLYHQLASTGNDNLELASLSPEQREQLREHDKPYYDSVLQNFNQINDSGIVIKKPGSQLRQKTYINLIEKFLDKAYLRLINQDLNTQLDWEMGIEKYKIEKELEEEETRKSLGRAKEVINKNIEERQRAINLSKCSEQSKQIYVEDIAKLEQLLKKLEPDSKAWEENKYTIIHEIETITDISFGNYLTNSEILQGIASRQLKMNELRNYTGNVNNLSPERTDELNSLMEQLTADQKFTLFKLKPTEYLEFFERFDSTFSQMKSLVPEFSDDEKAKDVTLLTDLQSQAKVLMRVAQREVHPDINPARPDESRELNSAYSELETILTNPNSHIVDQYEALLKFKNFVSTLTDLERQEIKEDNLNPKNNTDIESEEDQDGGSSVKLNRPDNPVKPNSGDGAAETIADTPKATTNTQDTQFQPLEPTPINAGETLTNQSPPSPEVNLSGLASKYTNPAITAGDLTGSKLTSPQRAERIPDDARISSIDQDVLGNNNGTTAEPNLVGRKIPQSGRESLSVSKAPESSEAGREVLENTSDPAVAVTDSNSDVSEPVPIANPTSITDFGELADQCTLPATTVGDPTGSKPTLPERREGIPEDAKIPWTNIDVVKKERPQTYDSASIRAIKETESSLVADSV